MDRIQIAEKIAEEVKKQGGRVFYVGGAVRDKLLSIDCKDVDIEVHGITAQQLYSILETIGQPLSFGQSFGVYAIKGYDLDIAMPRKEVKTGNGHKDFDISVDPFISLEDAARRRDFTINAFMEDVLTGEIIDCFNGKEDLKNKIIRHIDDKSFVEDPLRVLRAAQFSARFEFEIAEDTIRLCQNIDTTSLSRERIEEEMKKALLKADKPSIFFTSLEKMNQLDYWFAEIKQLIDIRQDEIYHPEGDVFTHTMMVLDAAAQYRDKVDNPYAFMLFALCHDLGKIVTTETVKGRIHAYNHEIEGVRIAKELLNRICKENDITKYVLNMIPLHMRPNAIAYNKSSIKSSNHLFDEAIAPKDLIYFSVCDHPIIMNNELFNDHSPFLFERLKIYDETMAKDYVKGQDLIDNGLIPDKDFSDILSYAHKLRLAGIEKENALKQTLAYARKNKKQ